MIDRTFYVVCECPHDVHTYMSETKYPVYGPLFRVLERRIKTANLQSAVNLLVIEKYWDDTDITIEEIASDITRIDIHYTPDMFYWVMGQQRFDKFIPPHLDWERL